MKKINTKGKNSNLENKIINLQLINNINKSNFYIRHLDARIKFFEKQLEIMKEQKPFIFQKKKLDNYYKEIENYKRQIKITHQKMKEEIDNISKIQDKLKD